MVSSIFSYHRHFTEWQMGLSDLPQANWKMFMAPTTQLDFLSLGS